MIFEILMTVSFLAGIHFIMNILLPIFITLIGTVFILDRTIILADHARMVIHQFAVDYLERTARFESIRDDHTRRELEMGEAGLQLRLRRAELRRLLDGGEINREGEQ